MIVLKALGIVSDREIVQLVCGNNDKFRQDFAINIEDVANLKTKSGEHVPIVTQQQALDYIGSKVKIVKRSGPGASWAHRRPHADEAIEVFATTVLAHVPVEDLNFRPKALYVATMVRRVLMAMSDEQSIDDRDYVGNKRLELSVFPDLLARSCCCSIAF